MDYLEGVLAFSVIMIVLSTVVSGIVEVIMRGFALRGHLLTAAIKLLIEKHLAPRIAEAGGATPGSVSDTLDSLTVNPSGNHRWFFGGRARVERLTAWAFMQRLAATDHGKAIISLGDAKAEAVLLDAVRTFERYTAAGAENLRKYSNAIALIIGIAMGPALNIHAPDLLEHLVKNAPARDALIAQGEAARDAYLLQEKELQQAIAELGSEDPVVRDAAERRLSEAATRLQTTVATVKDLAALDLPILYNSDHPERSWYWHLFGVLLGGLLIGLGGPFWYRVFESLSSLTRLVRGLGVQSRELASDPVAEKEAIVGSTPDTFDSAKILSDFKIAAGPAAQTLAASASGSAPVPGAGLGAGYVDDSQVYG